MLYVSFLTPTHALYFLELRGGEPAYIIRFQVSTEFFQAIRELTVSQRVGRMYPGFPQRSDPTKSGDSFAVGIPGNSGLFQWLVDSVIPGSVEIWRP
jgi:hypothetical protein